jgi:hypothetical protein
MSSRTPQNTFEGLLEKAASEGKKGRGNTLRRASLFKHFAEFEKCYGKDPNGRAKRKTEDSKDDRWRSFSIEEVKGKDYKIDGLKWLKEESLDEFDPDIEPQELATDAIAELEAAVEELNQIITMLEPNGNGGGKAAKSAAASKKV